MREYGVEDGAKPTSAARAGEGSPWRTGLRVAGLAAGGLGAGILGISAYAAYKLSRPRRTFGEGEPPEGSYEPVTFPSTDGLQLRGWLLPAAGEGSGVVLCHGFHTGRREMLSVGLALRDRGHHVLLFDFRSHGESEGRQTSGGLRETRDLEGAVRYLLARPEVKGDQVGVIGFSLGAAIAIPTASRLPTIGAVVADSSFATMREVVPTYFRAVFPLPSFPFAHLALWLGERLVGVKADEVRPMDHVGDLAPRPILLIHGTEDEIVPLTEAYLLYESAGEPRELWAVPGASHVGARVADFQGYVDRVDGFLKRHLSPAEGFGRPSSRSGGSSRS